MGGVKIAEEKPRMKGPAVPNPTLKDLEAQVSAVSDTYAKRFDVNRDDVWYLAKLSEELGELVQAYLKTTGRGRSTEMTPEQLREGLENEVADLFAQVLLFSKWQGIDIAGALERKWFKFL